MIELEDAIELAKHALSSQQETEHLPIEEAFGRVTGAAVFSPVAVPSFPRSGMDGYAIFAEDAQGASKEEPVTLTVVGTLFAGDDPERLSPSPGEAVRIMTGAGVPGAMDAVIKQEWTDLGDKTVQLFREVARGTNYSPIGEDIAAGQEIFPARHYLNSTSIGILASMGLETVEVLKPLRVGIISTGSELVFPGERLARGKIYNSNLYTLASFIRASQAELVFTAISSDDPAEFAHIYNVYADDIDLLITTGGVSVGEKDFMPQAIKEINGRELFHYVNMKPGTPMMASKEGERLILSLSGNPFASLVNFHLFYWETLAHFYQNPHFGLKREEGVIRAGEMKPGKLRRFVRANVKAGQVDITAKNHHSSVFHNLAESNCLIEQQAGQTLKAGDKVQLCYWKEA